MEWPAHPLLEGGGGVSRLTTLVFLFEFQGIRKGIRLSKEFI